ncbi:MAG TPA: hypothetical protein ENJ41_00365 [Oceanospirillales bacterium]|nr:hypothetical protein [Oceanospirillales bacterium]
MGLEIKITDSQIPPSKDFLDFLFRFRSGKAFNENWYDQLSEKLKPGSQQQVEERLKKHANKALTDEVIKRALMQSYNYTMAILLGEIEMIRNVFQKYKFIFVIGCPRSGGSYLTRQIYLSLGMKPNKVPGLIAHDGFPKAWPFYIGKKHNQHTDMTRYISEYLVMVDMFFNDRPQHENKIIIPKKDLNAAYHGAFFNQILGSDAEYIITVRHPVTSCISTYEKSGGYPEDGKFIARSTIENFASRDNIFTGADAESIYNKEYFDVYLRYWEQYHLNLALTGLCAQRKYEIVGYTRTDMMNAAERFHARFNTNSTAENFKVFDKRKRHTQWSKKAEKAVYRVKNVWDQVGLNFPMDEVMEAW